MTDRRETSTVNLTLTLTTRGGVPEDMTAQVMADMAAYAVRTSLVQCRVEAVVSGHVSSAFIVRTDRSGEAS